VCFRCRTYFHFVHYFNFSYFPFLLHCLLVVLCWCPLVPPYCPLLLLVDIPFLCSIGVCQCPPILLCWCSLVHLCCALLVFVGASLVFFIDVHWCSLMPPCYILLMLVGVPLLCFVGAHRHPLVRLY